MILCRSTIFAGICAVDSRWLPAAYISTEALFWHPYGEYNGKLWPNELASMTNDCNDMTHKMDPDDPTCCIFRKHGKQTLSCVNKNECLLKRLYLWFYTLAMRSEHAHFQTCKHGLLSVCVSDGLWYSSVIHLKRAHFHINTWLSLRKFAWNIDILPAVIGDMLMSLDIIYVGRWGPPRYKWHFTWKCATKGFSDS